ncbi:MAG: YopT-type cysteine protease domain-containing protein [Sphingomonadales bacterium]|jgi:hypothetical protein
MIEKTLVSQGSILTIAGSDAPGVCLEACRMWVKSVLTNNWKYSDTVYEILDAKTIMNVLEVHQTRRTINDKTMEGYDIMVTSRQGGKGLRKFTGLRTREDVINTVLSVPGVYIYCATGKKAGGHAFAFNSSSNSLTAFFDPNQGEWQFTGESNDAVRTWWSDFWEAKGDGKLNYKNEFHKGERELWKVDIAA